MTDTNFEKLIRNWRQIFTTLWKIFLLSNNQIKQLLERYSSNVMDLVVVNLDRQKILEEGKTFKIADFIFSHACCFLFFSRSLIFNFWQNSIQNDVLLFPQFHQYDIFCPVRSAEKFFGRKYFKKQYPLETTLFFSSAKRREIVQLTQDSFQIQVFFLKNRCAQIVLIYWE